MDGLDDFLKSEQQPVAAEETAVQPEPNAEAQAPEAVAEEPKGPVRDDKGRFAPKGETEGASPAPEEAPLDHAALIGERRRRQESEARIAALEAQIAQLSQQPAQPAPDMFEDPQGWQS